LVVPDEGGLVLLEWVIFTEDFSALEVVLRLFRANYVPAANTTLSSFTEADFTGYAEIVLDRDQWQAPVTLEGRAYTQYQSAPQQWTCGATGNTIYGWYLVETSAGVVLAAEAFAIPRVLTDLAVLDLMPVMRLRSEPAP